MAEPDNIPATIPEEEDTPQPTLEQLNALHASATKEYSLKNYSLAAELYSEATEIQAQLNGEMNPENADLLYQYGRCLYHVAVSKSDVLGGKVASSSNEPAKKKPKTKSTKDDKPVETTVNETKSAPQKETDNTTNKPFFQITGDENWTDSEPDDDDDDAEDVDDAAQDAQDEQDEDDFAIAYEILDVARVLLTRKLDSLSQQSSSNNTNGTKGKAREIPPEQTPQGKQIMERLADTHDLQAEISLENERFADAVADEKASLELKLRIFPQESSLVAEAHYKLSLALEFASVTQTTATTTTTTDGAANETEAAGGEEAQVDEVMREEAVQHMESAIASCKLRVDKETASLASLSPEQKREKEASIKDVTEMIGDMEQRLIDLRNPSLSLNNQTATGTTGDNPDAGVAGILGTLLGESKAEQKARIAEVTATANDLTGMVKKKKKKVVEESGSAGGSGSVAQTGNGAEAVTTTTTTTGKGKRKMGDEDEGEEGGQGKRVRTEE